jgi:hypothetical protein
LIDSGENGLPYVPKLFETEFGAKGFTVYCPKYVELSEAWKVNGVAGPSGARGLAGELFQLKIANPKRIVSRACLMTFSFFLNASD